MTIQRKIIHIDMNAFFVSVEERDDPSLRGFPVAVGGDPTCRGVISTANYIARKSGVRSAISSKYAKKLCPDLIIIRPNMEKYKEASQRIMAIFQRYTDIIEPLSLDEAYLDVSENAHCSGSASLLAKEIRQRIWEEEKLTGSAGISTNKFLSKVASGWRKPNQQTVIEPDQIKGFVSVLPVKHIPGVGIRTQQRLLQMGVRTCNDLYQMGLRRLTKDFGVFGHSLYMFAQGIDKREVEPYKPPKSISVEETFPKDLESSEKMKNHLFMLIDKCEKRLSLSSPGIRAIFVKLKGRSLKQTTAECVGESLEKKIFLSLFEKAYQRLGKQSIRLIGVGVRLKEKQEEVRQLSLFER